MSDRWLFRTAHPAARVWAFALAVWLGSPSPTMAQGARVTLLPAGPRASVVVELDEGLTGATAIEATDDRTVAVEIGPVRGKVVNQLLQATADSPLVSQVRVRGITRGAEGTIVTIQVTGKAPISGSVRRSARRVYIDLAPLEVVRPAAAEPVRPPNLPPQSAPVLAAAAPAAAPAPPTGAVPSRATARAGVEEPEPRKPALRPVPRGAENAPLPAAATSRSGGAARAAASGPSSGAPSAPRNGLAAALTNPPPSVPASAAAPTPAPARTATAATAAPVRPAAPTPPPAAPPPAAASGSSAIGSAATAVPPVSDIEARAERLARVPDVRGVEKIKADLMAKRGKTMNDTPAAAQLDGLIYKVDQLVLEAQRNRLAADAALFRSEPPAAMPSPASQLAAVRALRPQLEQIARAVNGWNGGPPPQEIATLSATLPRLRELHLPPKMTEAHSVLCNSLEGLAVLWARSSAEPIAPGSEQLTPAVGRARSALEAFLVLERTLSTQPNAQ